MKTKYMLWGLFIFLVLGTSAYAQNNGNNKANKNIILLLFDPTILKQNEKNKYEEMMNKFGQFYLKIPERTELRVWIVEADMMNKDIAFCDTIKFSYTQKDEEELPKHRVRSFKKLKSIFDQQWVKYHHEKIYSKPTSCILTGLYMLSKKNSEYLNPINSLTNYKIYLFIISDMVELCTDWDLPSTIDEKYFSRLDKFQMNLGADLSKIYRTIIVKRPNEQISKPANFVRLQNFWTKVMSSFGIKEESLFYRYDFSGEFFNGY